MTPTSNWPKLLPHMMHMDYHEYRVLIDRLSRLTRSSDERFFLDGYSRYTIKFEDKNLNVHIERFSQDIIKSINMRTDIGHEVYVRQVYHAINDRSDENLPKTEYVALQWDNIYVLPFAEKDLPNELIEFIEDYF